MTALVPTTSAEEGSSDVPSLVDQEDHHLPYERPEVQLAGRFGDQTHGSGSKLAFDFYLTDRV
jgi:hypothetical protein